MRAVLHRSTEPPLPMGVVVRRLRPDDASALGSLMVSAYAGTVDDHGEPPELHASEARRTIAGEYGPVEWDASLLATLDGQLIGATVVTLDRAHLLLAFALALAGMAQPRCRNRPCHPQRQSAQRHGCHGVDACRHGRQPCAATV